MTEFFSVTVKVCILFDVSNNGELVVVKPCVCSVSIVVEGSLALRDQTPPEP